MRIPSQLNVPPTNVRIGMPNLSQANAEQHLLGKKTYTHCGPVAGANTLVWLSLQQAYFQGLVPVPSDGKFDPIYATLKVTEDLTKYMKTQGPEGGDNAGTTPENLMHGVREYVINKGYRFKHKEEKDEWKGWGAGQVPKARQEESPDIEWLLSGLQGTSNVIFHLGWYKKNDSEYSRIGGHFVTSAGYKSLESTQEHDVRLIIHDPSERSKKSDEDRNNPSIYEGEPNNCDLIQISNGILVAERGSISAENYLNMKNVCVRKGSDEGIVDGTFVFDVECRK